MGTTALDAMIDSHNDEQTELDAIVEEALLRQVTLSFSRCLQVWCLLVPTIRSPIVLVAGSK